MRTLLQALRAVTRNRSVAALAIGTLALGLGVSAALFSVVWSILLEPLPYQTPQHLVAIQARNTATTAAAPIVSFPRFSAIRASAGPWTDVAAVARFSARLSDGVLQENVNAARGTANIFHLLGVVPLYGRSFTEGDEFTKEPVAIVSHSLWRRRLNATTRLTDTRILLNGMPFTVIGVLPNSFGFWFGTAEPDVWITDVATSTTLTREQVATGAGYLLVVARVAPGTRVTEVADALRRVDSAYGNAHPGFADASFATAPSALADLLIGNMRTPLALLSGAVVVVLLIAAINVANLLLGALVARRAEIALRVALGASRARLFRHNVAEAGVIVGAAGVVGLLLAVSLVPVLIRLAPAELPRLDSVTVGWPAIVQTSLVCALLATFLGVVPLIQALPSSTRSALSEAGRSSTRSRSSRLLQEGLACLQVALAIIVVCTGASLFRHLWQLRNVDLGFVPDGVVTMRVPVSSTDDDGIGVRGLDQLVERIRLLPGVVSAGATSHLPVGDGDFGFYFFIEGDLSRGVGKDPVVSVRMITPDYFRSLGITVQRGRSFAASDTASSVPVAIVSESMARRYWGQSSVLGKRVANSRDGVMREIVGVVSDVRFGGPQASLREELYLPIAQRPWPFATVTVHAPTSTATIAAHLRELLRSAEFGRLEVNIVALSDTVAAAIARPRFTASLSSILAAVSLVLALSGVYAIVSLFVQERRQEFGVRMALGANGADILSLVLRHALVLGGVGVTIGLFGSVGATATLKALAPEVEPGVWATVAGGVMVLATVVLGAVVPALVSMRAAFSAVLRR